MRPVQTAETLGSSPIVLLDETRARWTGQQCEVIAVGPPEICENEDCESFHSAVTGFYPVWTKEAQEAKKGRRYPGTYYHNCNVEEGDWLLVRPRCFVLTDIEDVWVCKQSDVLARLTLA